MSLDSPTFRHASIADICNLTGSTFDAVHSLSKSLFLSAPFSLSAADRLCQKLRGRSAHDLFSGGNDRSHSFRVLAPLRFDGVYHLDQWLTSSGSFVRKGSALALINGPHSIVPFTIKTNIDGIVKHVVSAPTDLKGGELIAVIEASTPTFELVESVDIDLSSSSLKKTTCEVVKNGVLQPEAGKLPLFQPSFAAEPLGFNPQDSVEEDLSYALSNPSLSFQSFYNDQQVISHGLIDDDIVSLPSFDESLYCSLIREMHRFSLAEIADNRTDLAQKNAGLGAMVGGLLGLMSGNIFAPFLGHSYAKNMHDRGKRVEELLPDPNLLFYQDENSYLSWSKAQVTSPRLRRLIIDRRVKGNGNIFFRLLPAFVTADSVFPLQLFKIDSQSYFYRPLSAGIPRLQPNYDSIKIQRRYFHLRGEGVVNEAGFEVPVSGRDIEDYQCRVYRYRGSSLDYFYLDFKIHPGSVF